MLSWPMSPVLQVRTEREMTVRVPAGERVAAGGRQSEES